MSGKGVDTTIIKNGSLLNSNGDLINRGYLLIENGIIKKVGEAFPLPKNPGKNARIIDASGCVITPGLVNLHTHSPMSLMKGLGEDLDIESWFNDFVWQFEAKLKPDDIKMGAKLGIAEMLQSGVTAFADHYFYAEKIAEAACDTGIKADVAPTIFEDEKEIEKNIELVKKWRNKSSRIHFRFGPHSPYVCPRKILKKTAEKAKKLSSEVHIHVSETREQVEESLQEHGQTPFEYLNECGLLEIPAILAHGLWLKEKDIPFLSSEHYMAVSPKTYLKLGMGRGNIWQFYNELPLSIGTDGAASSNTLNPLEQARLFALLGKDVFTPEDFKLKEIWKLMMKGHEALNFNSGALEAGKAADLVIWDLSEFNVFPGNNPIAALLYSSETTQARDVIIDGDFIVKNNRLTTIEKNSLFNRCRKIIERVKEDSDSESPIAEY